MQKFTILKDLEFLNNVDLFINNAKEAGRFSISYSYFSGGHAILHFKKKLIDYALIHNWSLEVLPILSFLQKNSDACFLYGSDFTDESFMGQGINTKRFLSKKGKVYHVDLEKDLWADCELFWGDIDFSNPPSYSGEIYFYLKNHLIDWRSFFKNTKNPRVYITPRAGLSSIAGYKKAQEHVKSGEQNIIIQFNHHTLQIFAHPNIIGQLARLSMAYSQFDNANGYTFDTETSRPILLGLDT